jgi:hypothetical protein
MRCTLIDYDYAQTLSFRNCLDFFGRWFVWERPDRSEYDARHDLAAIEQTTRSTTHFQMQAIRNL